MEQLLDGYHKGKVALPPMDLHFVSGAKLPVRLRALPSGLHEVELGGRGLHMLLVDENGERFALIDDQSDFEQIEMISYLVLALAFSASVLPALGIGRALASRVIAPVTMLAQAVEHGNLQDYPTLLSSKDEIGALARSFDARTAELQQALSRERLFTTDVSHELRAPLTAMLGAAELLTVRLSESPELHAAAERIHRNGADMAARVSALLQLARTPESVSRDLLDLRSIVQREFERCRPLLEGRHVEVRLEAPEAVWLNTSAELAAIAIDNLLRNACLFTQQGVIMVRLTPATLMIEDTGPGLPESVRVRLSERFVRGSDNSRGGSGLGLSIVKRVAEHLGWNVRFDDQVGGGSRFTLSFGKTGGESANGDLSGGNRAWPPSPSRILHINLTWPSPVLQ